MYICSMFMNPTYTYGQIEWSPDARNSSYEDLRGEQIKYTIVPTKTGQSNATNR